MIFTIIIKIVTHYAGFEKDVEYKIDVEFKRYTTKKKWVYMYITKHKQY